MARFFHIESGEFTVAGNPTSEQVRSESKSSFRAVFGFFRVIFRIISDLRKK